MRLLSRYTLQFRSVALGQSGIVVGQRVGVASSADGGLPEMGTVSSIEDHGSHVRVAIQFVGRVATWRFPGHGEGEELAERIEAPQLQVKAKK